jgi:hypothetical protein
MSKMDVYGLMQRWIMTVKDHSTGLVYLVALSQKKAYFVAAELEKYSGFIGFPHILHTDNGKEFITTLVVDMIMKNNPNCFVVMGHPRTPRDQGSVESANKLVKRVLMSLCSKRCLQGVDTNWTRLLGHIMLVCNSHSGSRKHSISSYEAVFGQKYHPLLKCNVSEMGECWSIFELLRLSPDEQLAMYVQDHKIVDITEITAAFDDEDADMDNSDEGKGMDINDDSFPEVLADKDIDELEIVGNQYSPGVHGVGDKERGPNTVGSDQPMVKMNTTEDHFAPVVCQLTYDSPAAAPAAAQDDDGPTKSSSS